MRNGNPLSLVDQLSHVCVPRSHFGQAAPVDLTRWSWNSSAGVTHPLPFIWHDAPWHRVGMEIAADCAQQAMTMGVCVAGLKKELNLPSVGTRRILPLRPDRYGVLPDDFEHACLIDLRLCRSYLGDGGRRYSTDQLCRWTLLPTPERLRERSDVDRPTWPAEIKSEALLAKKVQQLRQLSHHESGVWLTVDALHVQQALPWIHGSGADGVVLHARGHDAALLPEALAMLKRLRAEQGLTYCIAVVADLHGAEDVALLWQMGAEVIGLDALLEPILVTESVPTVTAAAPSLFSLATPPPPPRTPRIRETIELLVEDCATILSQSGRAAPF